MAYVIEILVLFSHLSTYKEEIAEIGMTFGLTFVLSKIMGSIEDKNKADMIKIGGYSLTLGCFAKYLAAVKANSIIETPKGGGGIIGEGLLKTIIDAIKDIKK